MSEAVERRKAYSKVLYGPFPQFCSSLYVYGAVAPLSGKHFFTEEAKLNTDGFRTFIDGLAERFEASFNVLVLDNGSFHKANRLDIPENVALVFLPPYSPELNLAERLWEDLKDRLALSILRKGYGGGETE